MAERQRPERTVYEAGGGRKSFLALAFLILLPFYASLPAMLIQRLIHGLWFDTIGLMVFSAIFTALMALLGRPALSVLRSRVELGDTAVKITLPQGSGATPMLRFVNREIPYDQIAGGGDPLRAVRQGVCAGAAARDPPPHQGRPACPARQRQRGQRRPGAALPRDRRQDRPARRRRGGRRRHGAPLDRAARAGLPRPQDRHRGEPAADRRRRRPRSRPGTRAPCAT